MSLEGFGGLVMLKQVPTLLHPQGSFRLAGMFTFAISSLLFVNGMYNAASVIMRLSPKNACSATAPASLTKRNSYLIARPETQCAGAEHARSGTYGRREN
jgi:hypothetical protein